MSYWCEKCQKLNYEYGKCVGCGHINEDKSKSYTVPKYKKQKILNMQNESHNKITLKKNTILIVATVIISISISYLAISKYRENRMNDEFIEMMFGTSDPDEIKEHVKTSLKEMTQSINKSNEKMINQISNIKVPVIDFGKQERERTQKKKIEERKKQIAMQNFKRKKEIEKQKEKEKLLLQMQH